MGALRAALRWEWFKLIRRPLPWVLLAVAVLATQVTVWEARDSYQKLTRERDVSALVPSRSNRRAGSRDSVECLASASPDVLARENGNSDISEAKQADCRSPAEVLHEGQIRRWQRLALPGSLLNALGALRTFALLLVAILTASTVGMEYGLGTLRPVLAEGVGRVPFVVTKFLALVALVGAGLAFVLVTTALGSLIATSLSPPPPEAGIGAAGWVEVAQSVARIWLGAIPYIAFTGAVAVVLRSSAAATAVALGYFFAELITTIRMGTGSGLLSEAGRFLLVCNISYVSGASDPGTIAVCGASGQMIHALLVLSGYTLASGAVALTVFLLRDVSGARGE